jgi:hypothetical protein
MMHSLFGVPVRLEMGRCAGMTHADAERVLASVQPQEIVGRLAIPANDIARAFDSEYQTQQQQWDMVLFLDGDERQKRAVEAGVTAFRGSWQRPKWHILQQGVKQAKADAKP